MYSNKYAATKELAQWQHHLAEHWYNITIADVNITQLEGLEVNKPIAVTAKIDLGELTDHDIQVELYQGDLNEKEEIVNTAIVLMQNQGKEGNLSIYQAETNYSSSGLKGISVRIFPKHKYLSNSSELGLILWA
jgi:glycogen phosphorylase